MVQRVGDEVLFVLQPGEAIIVIDAHHNQSIDRVEFGQRIMLIKARHAQRVLARGKPIGYAAQALTRHMLERMKAHLSPALW